MVKVSFITKRSEGRHTYLRNVQRSIIARPGKWEGLAEIKQNAHCCFTNYVLKEFGLQDSMMWFHLTQDRIILLDESDSWERICIGFENSFRGSAKQHLILKRYIII